jgi:hypothetical protein
MSTQESKGKKGNVDGLIRGYGLQSADRKNRKLKRVTLWKSKGEMVVHSTTSGNIGILQTALKLQNSFKWSTSILRK